MLSAALNILSASYILTGILGLLLIYLYRKSTENFDVFERQGISGPKPVPFLGNMWGVWRRNIPNYDVEMLRKYGKTWGTFDGRTPNLITVDENLLKSIFIKDFDHFVNHRDMGGTKKYFRKTLVNLRNQEWKDVRSAITPTLTTGKIKRMSELIKEATDRLLDNLEDHIMNKEGKFYVKSVLSSFTLDVIARCAFGLKIDNLTSNDHPFLKNAQVVFNPPNMNTPVIMLPMLFFKLRKYLSDLVFVTKEFQFFVDILESVVESRANSHEKFNDFVEIANEALRSALKETSSGKTEPMWSKEESSEILIAQCILFLLAGFDTTATTLSNAFYLLAKNPDVQEKLHDEICEKIHPEEELTHELVNSIPYVEQVINEVLRLYPPAYRAERECSKEISYGNLTIPKGMIITVPIFALHRMEEHFPDPERFDPDRWTTENKAKRNPYVFMPFSLGPRNCVGMRFALEEMKFALCAALRKFRLVPVEETPDTLKTLDGFQIIMQFEKFYLGVEPR